MSDAETQTPPPAATARGFVGVVLWDVAQDACVLPPGDDNDEPERELPLEPFDKKTPPGLLQFDISDLVAGQLVPRERSAWLTLRPLKDADGGDAVLRARMRFLYHFVLVSMTVLGDWQTQLSHFLRDLPEDEFRWFPTLYRLIGGAYARPQLMRVMAALRWQQPRFLLEVFCRRSESHGGVAARLEPFLLALDAFTQRGRVELERWEQGLDPDPVKEDDIMDHIHFGDSIRASMGELDCVMLPRRERTVEVGLSIRGGSLSAALVTEIVDLLERFAAAEVERREVWRANGVRTIISFRVTTIVIEERVEMNAEALETLAQRVTQSQHLRIEALRVNGEGDFPRLPLHKTLVHLTSLHDLKSCRPLKRLRVDTTTNVVPAFGAALRYDTALREIDLGYDAGDMDGLAAWLAFGVFHRDSRSNITSVTLRMSHRYGPYGEVWMGPPYEMCSRRWVETFKRVLTHVASEKDLAFVHSRILRGDRKKKQRGLTEITLPTDQRVLVEVKPGTLAYEQPQRQAKKQVLTVTAEDFGHGVGQFEVVRKLSGWVAIVIPGVGVGWIGTEAVTSERACASLVRASREPRVTSLTWTGGYFPEDEDALKREHADALMDFLALIGKPLEVLQLPSMGLQNRHVARIVRCCPNLKELNISGNEITDIGPIVHAYETGRCRITSLSVAQTGREHVTVVRQAARIVELCNFPRDLSDAAASRRPILRELSLRVSPFTLGELLDFFENAFKPLNKALVEERGLEYLRLHCDQHDYQETCGKFASVLPRNGEVYDPDESEEEDHYEMVDDEGNVFQVERGESYVTPPPPAPVWVTRALPLSSRLAFLSALRDTSSTRGGEIDRHVLTLIFEMAKTRQPRMVDVVPDQHGFAFNDYFV